MVDLKALLNAMLKWGASDLHLTAHLPPQIRVDGSLIPLDQDPLTPEDSRKLCYEIISEEQRKRFETERELDFSFSFEEKSRFRGNLYFDRGFVTGAFRAIPLEIPSPSKLGIPNAAMDLIERPRGLVLITGPTGSGKSTTLAAMIDRINQTQRKHIITVEDPIEFVYKSRESIINQREVSSDTVSFAEGLRHIMRQDPDIVLIGEMRDLETISAAITISETGHLVFATLHTNTTVETVNRIIDVFPPHQQSQVRTQLSFTLIGALSQKLLPKIGKGRALAMEILVPNYAIRNLIRENKIHQIYSHMLTGQAATSMQTMDQALAHLVKQGVVEKEIALAHSTEPQELEKLLGPSLRATQ